MQNDGPGYGLAGYPEYTNRVRRSSGSRASIGARFGWRQGGTGEMSRRGGVEREPLPCHSRTGRDGGDRLTRIRWPRCKPEGEASQCDHRRENKTDMHSLMVPEHWQVVDRAQNSAFPHRNRYAQDTPLWSIQAIAQCRVTPPGRERFRGGSRSQAGTLLVESHHVTLRPSRTRRRDPVLHRHAASFSCMPCGPPPIVPPNSGRSRPCSSPSSGTRASSTSAACGGPEAPRLSEPSLREHLESRCTDATFQG